MISYSHLLGPTPQVHKMQNTKYTKYKTRNTKFVKGKLAFAFWNPLYSESVQLCCTLCPASFILVHHRSNWAYHQQVLPDSPARYFSVFQLGFLLKHFFLDLVLLKETYLNFSICFPHESFSDIFLCCGKKLFQFFVWLTSNDSLSKPQYFEKLSLFVNGWIGQNCQRSIQGIPALSLISVDKASLHWGSAEGKGG